MTALLPVPRLPKRPTISVSSCTSSCGTGALLSCEDLHGPVTRKVRRKQAAQDDGYHHAELDGLGVAGLGPLELGPVHLAPRGDGREVRGGRLPVRVGLVCPRRGARRGLRYERAHAISSVEPQDGAAAGGGFQGV